MKSIKEVRDWLIANRTNRRGNLDLVGLDFSNFDGNVIISYMKVKETLFQNCQQVKKDLFQDSQKVKETLFQNRQQVKKDLFQDDQEVEGSLFQGRQRVLGSLAQHSQIVKGDLYSHKLEKDELWGDTAYNYVFRIKALKPITKEELAKMGYELKEGGVN